MTELKTLKDFKVNPKSWAGAMANAGRKYTIDIPELKQEAIKWIKEIDKCLIFDECKGCPFFDDKEIICKNEFDIKNFIVTDARDSSKYMIKALFIHFFDITEEDLK